MSNKVYRGAKAFYNGLRSTFNYSNFKQVFNFKEGFQNYYEIDREMAELEAEGISFQFFDSFPDQKTLDDKFKGKAK